MTAPTRPRRVALAALVASLGLLPLAGASLAGGDGPPSAKAPFVVHEWGTFTSVQGADGVGLEGLAHEEEALPDFVYSRAKVRACPLRDQGYKGLERPAQRVTQKMETPVLYFHTDVARRARVRVDFVKGLITQWYPVTDLLGPPEGAADAGPIDVSRVDRSFLEWEVDLLPRGSAAPAELPAVADDVPWAFARKVDAAWVRTVPRHDPGRAGPTEAERYLFYRGLGAFTLPMTVAEDAEGRLSFRNGSAHPVAAVVALDVSAGHKSWSRYNVVTDVAPGSTASDLFGSRPRDAYREGGSEGLRSDVTKLLVSQGMNPDEARAMVDTWARSWFSTDGVRVFYVVPRPLVDALLPLKIDPAPDRVERALVGRIELLFNDRRERIERALRILAVADPKGLPPGDASWAEGILEGAGRFLEPFLRGVLASTKDPGVRAEAERRLAAVK